MRIAGYAAIFDHPDKGGDILRRGAFARLPDHVPLLWQHDPARPIGRIESLKEDGRGLRVIARLIPDVAIAREAGALLRGGVIDGLSIGYRTRRARAAGSGRRELMALDLLEVSVVTFPMQPLARVLGVHASPATPIPHEDTNSANKE